MVSIPLFCLILYQTSSVLSDGINLPIASMAYKQTTADQNPLSISFSPNVCVETPTFYIPAVVRTGPVSQPCLPPQPVELSSPQLPLNTVSVSTPRLTCSDPYLQTIEAPLGIQCSPNVAITPQLPTCPQNYCPKLEDNLARNTVTSDRAQTVTPPIVQTIPGYFVTSKDSNGNIRTTLKVDSIPGNVCRLKVADSKPIFIDCSNPMTYKSPITLTPVNPREMQTIQNPCTAPKLEVSSLIVDNSNLLREDFIPQPCVKVLEDNIPLRPIINLPKEQCRQTVLNNDQMGATETITSTERLVYPINNVKFNFGPNAFNSFQSVCPEKPQPCSLNPPKIDTNTNIGLVVSPAVSIVDNPFTTQCNNNPPEFVCNCNVNSLPKPESVCIYPNPTCRTNEAYFPKPGLPIAPITQLPNVNTLNTPLVPTSLPIMKQPLGTTSDKSISRLSYSLNNIISLLTAGLLSKVFGAPKPVDIPNVEISCISLIEPLIEENIEETSCVSSLLLTPCPSVDLPVISPTPIDVEVIELDPIVPPCLQNAPKRKPYLASITINLVPDTNTQNDIIIIV